MEHNSVITLTKVTKSIKGDNDLFQESMTESIILFISPKMFNDTYSIVANIFFPKDNESFENSSLKSYLCL